VRFGYEDVSRRHGQKAAEKQIVYKTALLAIATGLLLHRKGKQKLLEEATSASHRSELRGWLKKRRHTTGTFRITCSLCWKVRYCSEMKTLRSPSCPKHASR
jgi:hypothetical protein